MKFLVLKTHAECASVVYLCASEAIAISLKSLWWAGIDIRYV